MRIVGKMAGSSHTKVCNQCGVMEIGRMARQPCRRCRLNAKPYTMLRTEEAPSSQRLEEPTVSPIVSPNHTDRYNTPIRWFDDSDTEVDLVAIDAAVDKWRADQQKTAAAKASSGNIVYGVDTPHSPTFQGEVADAEDDDFSQVWPELDRAVANWSSGQANKIKYLTEATSEPEDGFEGADCGPASEASTVVLPGNDGSEKDDDDDTTDEDEHDDDDDDDSDSDDDDEEEEDDDDDDSDCDDDDDDGERRSEEY